MFGFMYNFDAGPEVGQSQCRNGEIADVYILPSARQCGLATIFTILCFKDHDMNGPNGNLEPSYKDDNQAWERIKQYKQEAEYVEESCSSLWYLLFVAEPISGGFANFNAAEASLFMQMLMRDRFGTMHGPKATAEWKSQFDSNTGMIGNIDAYHAYWFFCRLKQKG